MRKKIKLGFYGDFYGTYKAWEPKATVQEESLPQNQSAQRKKRDLETNRKGKGRGFVCLFVYLRLFCLKKYELDFFLFTTSNLRRSDYHIPACILLESSPFSCASLNP